MLTQGKRDVVEHRHVRKQSTKLKQHAHAPTQSVEGRVRQVRDIGAEHINTSSMRTVLATQQPKHGCLPTARRTQQGRHFTNGYLYRYVVQYWTTAGRVSKADAV